MAGTSRRNRLAIRFVSLSFCYPTLELDGLLVLLDVLTLDALEDDRLDQLEDDRLEVLWLLELVLWVLELVL